MVLEPPDHADVRDAAGAAAAEGHTDDLLGSRRRLSGRVNPPQATREKHQYKGADRQASGR